MYLHLQSFTRNFLIQTIGVAGELGQQALHLHIAFLGQIFKMLPICFRIFFGFEIREGISIGKTHPV